MSRFEREFLSTEVFQNLDGKFSRRTLGRKQWGFDHQVKHRPSRPRKVMNRDFELLHHLRVKLIIAWETRHQFREFERLAATI